MGYKWRATFGFDYPLLDIPVDIGDIRLYPAPPELDLAPHAIHCYEFETSALNRDGQQEAEKMYLARLERLAELSVLSPYYTEVAFHSLVLIDSGGSLGYPCSGINFRASGKPYVPPGQAPEKFRQELIKAAQPFLEIQSLREEIREPVSRSLRWLYRGKDYRLSADDQLIYRWIAFNSLYALFNFLEGSNDRSERETVKEFEDRFRSSVGIVQEGVQHLAESGLQLNRGKNKNVSGNLLQSINATEPCVTQRALECVYAARCALFHGAERPLLHVSNVTMVVAAKYLDTYLKRVIGPFVSFCMQKNKAES